ncbi:UDP-glucose 6-dehydrogenase [Streptacidiphilus sp. MAP12-16]
MKLVIPFHQVLTRRSFLPAKHYLDQGRKAPVGRDNAQPPAVGTSMRRRDRMVELAREQCGGNLLGRRIAVQGAAFKPDSDDVRDSPALNVAARLQLHGADVTVYDPKAMDNARKMYPNLGYAVSPTEAAHAADLVLHLTEWQEFAELDPVPLANQVAHPRMLDGRNALDPQRWRAAGWTYRALGRP